MTEPTSKQKQYLSFIHAYTQAFGLPPAESEIALAMKVSAPSVNQMMKTLGKKGFIRRTPETARSIELLISPSMLPRWTDPITSTRKVWMAVPARPAPRSSNNQAAADDAVYSLKNTLLNTKPPIWRRIETRHVTIDGLHQ
ncbi:MAG: LexA family transcriptional regulator, partial [Planctomycetaceae bacterium]